MALPRGVDPNQKVGSYRSSNEPYSFYLKPGARATIVILDEQPPVAVVRHQAYLKGLAGERCTCAAMDPRTDEHPDPKRCVVCNAMLAYDRISRKKLYYVTVIRDDPFTSQKGKTYKDMKYLLEMTEKEGELFENKRLTSGGNLSGMRYSVFRSSGQNSPRLGDDWQSMGQVSLLHHFWESPAIEKAQKRALDANGTAPQWEQSVKEFVTPYNYDEILGVYTPQHAEQFVAKVARKVGDNAGSNVGESTRFAPPPHPDGTVPVSAVPTYNVQAQAPRARVAVPPPPSAVPQQPVAQGYPPAPPALPPAPPASSPRVPDPVGATVPIQHAPPPPPPLPTAPRQTQVSLAPPPPPPAPTPAQVAGQYNFQLPTQGTAGWSPTADPFSEF